MIKVLDLSTSSNHTAAYANIHGDFDVTRFTSLAGVDLSLFNVLYVGEHMPPNDFADREAEITAAMTAGNLGLVAENDSSWDKISLILGETITSITNDVPPLVLTGSGATHETLTGAGIDGGSSVNIANLSTEDTFSAIPAAATVLVEDSVANPIILVGTLGLSRYFISGTEFTETNLPSDADELMLAHNAIHFTSVASVAMLNTSKLKIRGWQCHYKVLGRTI